MSKNIFTILSNEANKENVSITLNCNNIYRVNSHKFLGVTIEDALKIDVHVNKVCTIVPYSIGVIRRVSSMVPDNILHSIYYALIYSLLTYAICAWGSAYPTAPKRLESLVRKTI